MIKGEIKNYEQDFLRKLRIFKLSTVEFGELKAGMLKKHPVPISVDSVDQCLKRLAIGSDVQKVASAVLEMVIKEKVRLFYLSASILNELCQDFGITLDSNSRNGKVLKGFTKAMFGEGAHFFKIIVPQKGRQRCIVHVTDPYLFSITNPTDDEYIHAIAIRRGISMEQLKEEISEYISSELINDNGEVLTDNGEMINENKEKISDNSKEIMDNREEIIDKGNFTSGFKTGSQQVQNGFTNYSKDPLNGTDNSEFPAKIPDNDNSVIQSRHFQNWVRKINGASLRRIIKEDGYDVVKHIVRDYRECWEKHNSRLNGSSSDASLEHSSDGDEH